MDGECTCNMIHISNYDNVRANEHQFRSISLDWVSLYCMNLSNSQCSKKVTHQSILNRDGGSVIMLHSSHPVISPTKSPSLRSGYLESTTLQTPKPEIGCTTSDRQQKHHKSNLTVQVTGGKLFSRNIDIVILQDINTIRDIFECTSPGTMDSMHDPTSFDMRFRI